MSASRGSLVSEVGLLRLVAQRLVGTGWATAAEAVRGMLAVQAQDLPGALASVALRLRRRDRAEVEDALAAGAVVRSWPMRGTLHLVAAEDLRWMLDLLAGRELAGRAARRDRLGLSPADLERAESLARDALAGGRRLSRAELFSVWEEGGVGTGGQRGYHLLSHLACLGVVCLGPPAGREQLVVLLEEWVPAPRVLAREEALGELAERYVRGHGPATVQDLARWAGLPLRDARAGLALVRDRLERMDVDGTEHWLDPATPGRLAAVRREARGVLLLPGFDEFVLGYADRSAVLAPEHAARLVPGGNGVFRPAVVSDGRVVGTWARGTRRSGPPLTVQWFDQPAARVEAAVGDVVAALP